MMENKAFVPGVHGSESCINDYGDFAVEVMRFKMSAKAYSITRELTGQGKTSWCVYVHIKPTHPLYPTFTTTKNEFDAECEIFPFHGGCTYFNRLEDGTIKIGCDFSHSCDWDQHGAELADVPDVEACGDELRHFMEVRRG